MLTSTSIALLASNSIFLGLAVIAVILRFTFRQRTIPGLGKDDWLILVALFAAIGLCLTNIISVPVGHVGQDFDSLSPSQRGIFLKFSFAWQFFYLFSVAFVKFSILHFYGRIFAHHAFLLAKQLLIWIIVFWLVSFFWATLFKALPIQCNWINCMTPSTNYPVMYICSSATDVAIDSAILVMPLTMLRVLEMNRRKKMAVAFIFSLGIFCVVASVARLAYTVRFGSASFQSGQADFRVNFREDAVNIIMWSGIEACASIICACLPCFGHYLTNIPAVNRVAFKHATIKDPHSPLDAVSEGRYTGGTREMSRGRRLRMSGLSNIDTKMAVSSPRGRRGTDGSSAEFMITTLPSPLMTPKVRGNPTRRDLHEPEIEMGKIHLRTGSEESVGGGTKEVV